ncbi:hypothetical protein KW800_00315 [Candidatus Parcubacteria bacterium]|nr:hypothetical protein [Candidatus Parcubacteria bacterium]
MVQRAETDSLPKNNQFFSLTPELRAKAEENLADKLKKELWHVSAPGDGEAKWIITCLNDVQKNLKTWKEFGYLVNLLDEAQFPVLADAIGPLKRAGLTEEIDRIMMDLMNQCFLQVPEEVKDTTPARPGFLKRIAAAVSR